MKGSIQGEPRRLTSLAISIVVFLVMSGRWAGAQDLKRVEDLTYRDCYVILRGDQLTMGNPHLKRSWRIDHGQLFSTSLFDVDSKTEWMSTPASLPSPTPPTTIEPGAVEMRAGGGVFGPTEAESLRVNLLVTGAHSRVLYAFQIFPEAGGIRITVSQEDDMVHPDISKPDVLDAIEHIETDRPHLRFTQVTLRDRTDNHNELVFEDEWLLQPNEALLELQGNIFFLEDTVTGSGLIFLKEAPLPEMRAVKSLFDARMKGSLTALNKSSDKGRSFFDISFYGHGFEGSGHGYPSALLAYHGGRSGRIAALQRYQRQIRVYRPERDGQLLSNTWGDRSGGTKINEAFIRHEIDAGKELGVDIVQIDDGWEVGQTIANKGTGGVWEGYRVHQSDFWKASPDRFPHGLARVSDYARARGVRLGLWFGPDSYEEFKDWKLDADQLLAWNAIDHIAAFKLDSVKLRSKRSETNYHALVDRVLEKSSGNILLDLDVTAETRQGYFGNIAAGPIFVENRYTDWHRYWPHQTLRNLWKLSQYVDPVRMRIEFLNSERNTTLYRDDPLAPANYRPSCLFATAMFASPLGWFETTSLSNSFIADAKPVIAEWKEQRKAMYEGTIIPIGEAPDGITWTGFESVAQDGRSGYLLIFRELNGETSWYTPRGDFKATSYRIAKLGGEGTVTQSADGFKVEIAKPLGFVWVRLEASH